MYVCRFPVVKIDHVQEVAYTAKTPAVIGHDPKLADQEVIDASWARVVFSSSRRPEMKGVCFEDLVAEWIGDPSPPKKVEAILNLIG